MLQTLVQTIKPVVNLAMLLVVATLLAGVAHAAEMVQQEEVALLRNTLVQKDYARALELIHTLGQEQQQRLDVRFYRATALAGAGQTREAIAAFKQLIADEPQYPEFYNNLAMVLVEEGRLLEAQQALESGLRNRESYAMLYNNLTVVFETMARHSYAQALRVKREQSPVLSPLLSLEDFTLPAVLQPTVVAVVDEITAEEAAGAVEAAAPVVTEESVSAAALQEGITEQASDASTVITAVVDERQSIPRQIEGLLNRWIDSWQKKDLDGYINSYSAGFKSRSYKSHQAWLQGRKERIAAARKIDISIEKINIEVLSNDRVQTEFMMDYRSDGYSDRSHKRVVFKLIGDEWRIVRELTLKVVNS